MGVTASDGDTLALSSSLKNVCVAPRSGFDPATGQLFTDQVGTVGQEKSWVRAYIDETYLWFDEIPASVRADSYATPQAYFDALRTPGADSVWQAERPLSFPLRHTCMAGAVAVWRGCGLWL